MQFSALFARAALLFVCVVAMWSAGTALAQPRERKQEGQKSSSCSFISSARQFVDCILSREWNQREHTSGTIVRIKLDLTAQYPPTCKDQIDDLKYDLLYPSAKTAPGLINCETAKAVYELIVGVPPAWAICGMSEYSYEHFARCLRITLDRQADDKLLRAFFDKVTKSTGGSALPVLYQKTFDEITQAKKRNGLREALRDGVMLCRRNQRETIYPPLEQAYQQMTTGGFDVPHSEVLAVRRRVNCADILKLAAEVGLEGQVAVAPPNPPPTSAELPDLIKRRYERCVSPHRDNAEQQAMCACEVRVLSEAKITRAEWHDFIEKSQSPQKALPRCDDSYDAIADVLDRFSRIDQCSQSPSGRANWEIQKAANEFLLAHCSNLSVLLSTMKGAPGANPVALAASIAQRRGDFCTAASAGVVISTRIAAFKRNVCHRNQDLFICKGASALSCRVMGDPVRDALICGNVRGSYASEIEIAYRPASCDWELRAMNGFRGN